MNGGLYSHLKPPITWKRLAVPFLSLGAICARRTSGCWSSTTRRRAALAHVKTHENLYRNLRWPIIAAMLFILTLKLMFERCSQNFKTRKPCPQHNFKRPVASQKSEPLTRRSAAARGSARPWNPSSYLGIDRNRCQDVQFEGPGVVFNAFRPISLSTKLPTAIEIASMGV